MLMAFIVMAMISCPVWLPLLALLIGNHALRKQENAAYAAMAERPVVEVKRSTYSDEEMRNEYLRREFDKGMRRIFNGSMYSWSQIGDDGDVSVSFNGRHSIRVQFEDGHTKYFFVYATERGYDGPLISLDEEEVKKAAAFAKSKADKPKPSPTGPKPDKKPEQDPRKEPENEKPEEPKKADGKPEEPKTENTEPAGQEPVGVKDPEEEASEWLKSHSNDLLMHYEHMEEFSIKREDLSDDVLQVIMQRLADAAKYEVVCDDEYIVFVPFAQLA